MKTKIKYCVLGILIGFICVWVGSLIKCEILTHQHYNEFENVCKSDYYEVNYFKVLEYSPYDFSQVYLVANDSKPGEVLRLKYDFDNDSWYVLDYVSGWSKSGNADDIVYPYWWHFIYFLF